MITVTKFEKWRTSDGLEHSTEEMAHYHILNEELLDVLTRNDRHTRNEAQDILNDLSNYRKELGRWLDACDAMEKAAFQ